MNVASAIRFVSSRAVVSFWRKYGPLVLVNCLGSLPRNSVDRLTDLVRNDLNSVESVEELYNNQSIRFVNTMSSRQTDLIKGFEIQAMAK